MTRICSSRTNPVLVAIRVSGISLVMWDAALLAAQAFGGYRTWETDGHAFKVLTTASAEHVGQAQEIVHRIVLLAEVDQ